MITIKGNKKDGYVLIVKDGRYFSDTHVKHDELEELQRLLNKKLKVR